MRFLGKLLLIGVCFFTEVHVKANEVNKSSAEQFKRYVQYPLDCWSKAGDCLLTTLKQPAVVASIGIQIKLDANSVVFRDKNQKIHFLKGSMQIFSSDALQVVTEYGSVSGQNVKFWIGRRAEEQKVFIASIDGMISIRARKFKMKDVPLPSGFETYLGPQSADGNSVAVPYVFDLAKWNANLSEGFRYLTHLDLQGVLAQKEKTVSALADLYQESVDIAISEDQRKRAEREARLKSEADENHRIRNMFRERFSNVAE